VIIDQFLTETIQSDETKLKELITTLKDTEVKNNLVSQTHGKKENSGRLDEKRKHFIQLAESIQDLKPKAAEKDILKMKNMF